MLPSPASRARSALLAVPALLILLAACAPTLLARGASEKTGSGKKPLTFVDLMKFRTIAKTAISADGSTVAYQLQPDRGDGEVIVVRSDGTGERRIELGSEPRLSADGRWALATLVPSLEAVETADDEKPENGLALLELSSGELRTWERVKKAALSEDGRHLAILHTEKARELAEEAAEAEEAEGGAAEAETGGEAAEEGGAPPPATQSETVEAESSQAEAPAAKEPAATAPQEQAPQEPSSEEQPPEEQAQEEQEDSEQDEQEERLGTTLRLLDLEAATETVVEHVEELSFAETSSHLAYAVAAPGGDNGLFMLELGGGADAVAVAVTTAERGRYSAFAWTDEESLEEEPLFAFVAAADDEEGEPGDGAVWIWQASSGEGRAVATTDSAPAGSFIPSHNQLAWSRDGQRLFYGTKPRPRPSDEKKDDEEAFDAYDVEALLVKKGVDVWHVDDPLIKSNEREQWLEREKDRTFLAVYHRGGNDRSNIQLAGGDLREVRPSHNPRAAIGAADVPYLRERTWAGFFGDLYWISLADGDRQLVAERLPSFDGDFSRHLSPDGRFVAWYREPHWYLFDAESGTSRKLTGELGVSFADEDHDYPREAESYGLGGWLDDSSAVLIHDRYDLWSFATEPGAEAVNLTAGRGREGRLKLRLVDEGLDRDETAVVLPAGERILLHGERERDKNHGFWQLDGGELEELVESQHRYRFLTRAEDSGRLLFTRESYREFPDLRVSGPDLSAARRLSRANPQIDQFAWGHAELVRFTDVDGRESDAVLIRPETLEEGERCPVLVYYYRFFSQRLHSFNEPKVNHRPSFPVYASHGYCVFLPDVRFEIGRPGFSATKALVPAVQRIVDMGVADADAIGLHGHSWSGYQTAFVVTQTHLFAAAVAGAPVSNMTSAYGGIRYGSGLARLFQYEQGQSRLGRSLWQARDLYIENSPLFYADRIETPLLIQFGDADGAVPWTQGVELYLALRRLDKEAVFLQYHGEPHHLKQYPNKLDYSIKMKEFFDHYLKGAPAPVWLSEGVPYRGEADE